MPALAHLTVLVTAFARASLRRLPAVLVAAGLLAGAWGGAAVAGVSAVGEITLQLGGAWLVAADGSRRDAAVKGEVRIGDTLETDASGHVHVRFVDGGVVSVRPASRLVIEDYRQSGQSGGADQAGAIRFRLDQGTVRSITGRWGEGDRERFRLNTPLAAIGIKGTDFITHASRDSMRVAVYTGAIVAAPFGAGCRQEALGPCGGETARLLSAEMGHLMLELRRGQTMPAILPRNGMAAGIMLEPVAAAIQPPTLQQGEAVNQAGIQDALSGTPASLVWGRWSHVAQRAGDTLTVPRAVAAEGRERVAENSYYALYRLPQTAQLPESGTVGLSLASSQAHLVTTGTVLPAQVTGGQLSLDFAARRFDTALSLESAPTGAVSLAVSGGINADGTFAGTSDLQTRVRGAYAAGADRGAAYLFEKSTPHGMFMGITNWR